MIDWSLSWRRILSKLTSSNCAITKLIFCFLSCYDYNGLDNSPPPIASSSSYILPPATPVITVWNQEGSTVEPKIIHPLPPGATASPLLPPTTHQIRSATRKGAKGKGRASPREKAVPSKNRISHYLQDFMNYSFNHHTNQTHLVSKLSSASTISPGLTANFPNLNLELSTPAARYTQYSPSSTPIVSFPPTILPSTPLQD